MSNQNYDDIINMPRHISKKHTQMSLEARSAQFAPFAALTGYEELVKETGRLTDKRIEIVEEIKKDLDIKIQIIKEKLSLRPTITFTYFIKDLRKQGGKYKTISGVVRKINEYKQLIILEDNTEIPINEIINIYGDILKI